MRVHMVSHKCMGHLGGLAEGVVFNASSFDSMMVGREVIKVDLLSVYS